MKPSELKKYWWDSEKPLFPCPPDDTEWLYLNKDVDPLLAAKDERIEELEAENATLNELLRLEFRPE